MSIDDGIRSDRLAGDEGVVSEELVQLLNAAGRRGLSFSDLESWSEERGARELLDAALRKLSASAELVRSRRRWIALRHTDWTAGHVRVRGRGGAVLASGKAGELGYFIPSRHLKGARDGDLVLVRPTRKPNRDGRGRLPEAAVVEVLERGVSEVVGLVSEERGRPRLIPFDSKVKLQIDLPEGAKRLGGRFVAAKLHSNLEVGAGRVPATHLEDLGSLSETGTDVRVAVRHWGIPDEYPAAQIEETEAFPLDPTEADIAGRLDLRDRLTVTIDGETARDFDDAISIDGKPNGGYSLAVHIADVAHFVHEGSGLDLEAYRRGTSVYFPNRAIPMLPERISNGLCSLQPGVDRLALTAFLDFTADGDLESRRFAETVIRSDRRLIYSEVQRVLEKPRSNDKDDYGGVLDLVRSAESLMRRLLTRRVARGSIDFDLPEGSVELDTEGVTVGVKPGERTVAHRIIEELMIATNEAVAQELVGADLPGLFRVHTEPDRGRFEELSSFLEPLGIPLELDSRELHPSLLQDVLAAVAGHEEEPFVATLVLRAMKRAVYDPECRGHYALASRAYLHFTSPIRRYPDLLVHRILKSWIGGSSTGLNEAEAANLRARLPAVAEHTSSTERRAERAERALLQWKVVRLIKDRRDEVFQGHVTGVQSFGLFVQLDDYYVDGLLPISSLRDDYYSYEPEKHLLVGRKGGKFRLADAIGVRIAEVDEVERKLVLERADEN